MRHALAALALAAATILLIVGRVPSAHASTGPIPLNCDRACLESLIDQYLAALTAHDPKPLPLSANVKYTENDARGRRSYLDECAPSH